MLVWDTLRSRACQAELRAAGERVQAVALLMVVHPWWTSDALWVDAFNDLANNCIFSVDQCCSSILRRICSSQRNWVPLNWRRANLRWYSAVDLLVACPQITHDASPNSWRFTVDSFACSSCTTDREICFVSRKTDHKWLCMNSLTPSNKRSLPCYWVPLWRQSFFSTTLAISFFVSASRSKMLS